MASIKDRVTDNPLTASVDSPSRTLPPVLKDSAKVVIVIGHDAGRVFHLGKQELVIGRSSDAAIHLRSQDTSRRHARISQSEDGEFILEDLKSRNGTYINGVAIDRQVLNTGDKLMIGSSSVLLFTYQDGLEDQLFQLQKMETVGQLASGVAHDFNNILGAVLANISYLKSLDGQQGLGHGEVQDTFDDIETATRRAVELTRQLLTFSRNNGADARSVDISGLMGETLRLVTSTFGPEVEFKSDIKPGFHVLGDRSQLHQVLINLLINAADAMSGKGMVKVRVTQLQRDELDNSSQSFLTPGKYVVVSIKDHGPGIAPQICGKIFEPFFTTKKRGKGTGLGLAIVYNIVKKHGGHVTVDSQEGSGATFKIYLPRTDVLIPTREKLSQLMPTDKDMKKTVLVVDDEETVRNSTRRLLKSLGYLVLCADGGKEALRLFKQHRALIRVVLLDMAMPGMDGPETFMELKKLDNKVSVILCSGYYNESDIRWLLSAGALEFLPKPYDAEALIRVFSRTVFSK